MEEDLDYKRLYEEEKDKNLTLQTEVASFKLPSKAKLFYALNRNMNDLADMLNSIKLKELNLDDKNDKSFERLKIIWASIASLGTTVETLGSVAGITGNEEKDMQNRVPFIERIAIKRD